MLGLSNKKKIVLKVSNMIGRRRINNILRFMCGQCGTLYHIFSNASVLKRKRKLFTKPISDGETQHSHLLSKS